MLASVRRAAAVAAGRPWALEQRAALVRRVPARMFGANYCTSQNSWLAWLGPL